MVQHLPAALPVASALPETGFAALTGADREGFVSLTADRSEFGLIAAERPGFALLMAERPSFALTAPHFLLLRQKKVSKEKATPGYAVGCADCPALLGEPGGWLNSPLRGSNTASRKPPARLRCSALHMGPKSVAADKFAQKNTDFYGRLTKTPIFTVDRKSETLFAEPSAASSSAAGNGKKGEDCLRPAGPSSAAPRCSRAAQSTRHRRAPQRARLLFGYFFLARQEKVCPRVRRGNQPQPENRHGCAVARPVGSEGSGRQPAHRRLPTRSPSGPRATATLQVVPAANHFPNSQPKSPSFHGRP